MLVTIGEGVPPPRRRHRDVQIGGGDYVLLGYPAPSSVQVAATVIDSRDGVAHLGQEQGALVIEHRHTGSVALLNFGPFHYIGELLGPPSDKCTV